MARAVRTDAWTAGVTGGAGARNPIRCIRRDGACGARPDSGDGLCGYWPAGAQVNRGVAGQGRMSTARDASPQSRLPRLCQKAKTPRARKSLGAGSGAG